VAGFISKQTWFALDSFDQFSSEHTTKQTLPEVFQFLGLEKTDSPCPGGWCDNCGLGTGGLCAKLSGNFRFFAILVFRLHSRAGCQGIE
jgi:hypothetical protein